MAGGEEEPVHPRDTGDVLPWKQKQRMEVEGKAGPPPCRGMQSPCPCPGQVDGDGH